MRRKIDICHKCKKFYESVTDYGYYCEEYMPMEYVKPTSGVEFEQTPIPSKCRMLVEYEIMEWNNEKADRGL